MTTNICLHPVEKFKQLGDRGVILKNGALCWHYAGGSTFSDLEIRQVMGNVSKEWAAHLPFPIREGRIDEAQIIVTFASNGDDTLPFDFEPNVLGYAFRPDIDHPIASDIYLNNAVNFTLRHGTPTGTRLYDVIKHEMGHSLGLDHTTVMNDIMAPIYDPNNELGITKDSSDGLKHIYRDLFNTTQPSVPDMLGIIDLFSDKRELIKLREPTLIAIGEIYGLKLDVRKSKASHVETLWSKRTV